MNAPGTEDDLQTLTRRIEQLAALARHLREENRVLRQNQEQLAAERTALLNKNEQARSRVEAIIHRLKSLEQNA